MSRPLLSTGRHGHFLKSTCDMELIDTRINITDMTERPFLKFDRGHLAILKSTYEYDILRTPVKGPFTSGVIV